MKCLIILSVLSLAFCLPTVGKNVSIGQDGTITITEVDGKRIVISKGTDQVGNKHIEISVDGPFVPTKKIRILDENYPHKEDVTEGEYTREKRSSKKTSTSSSDVLTEIFKELEGPMDEKSYQKMLKKLQKGVDAGQVNPEILNIVQAFGENQQFVNPSNVLTPTELWEGIVKEKSASIGKSLVPAEQKTLLLEYLKNVLRQKIVKDSPYGTEGQSTTEPFSYRYPVVSGIPSGLPTREFVENEDVQGSPLNWQQFVQQQQQHEYETRLLQNFLLQKYGNVVPAAQSIHSYWPKYQQNGEEVTPYEKGMQFYWPTNKNVPVYQQTVQDVSPYEWGYQSYSPINRYLPVYQKNLDDVPTYNGRIQAYWPINRNLPVYQENVDDISPYKVHQFVDQSRWSVVGNQVPEHQWDLPYSAAQQAVDYKWPVVEETLPVYQRTEGSYMPVVSQDAQFVY